MQWKLRWYQWHLCDQLTTNCLSTSLRVKREHTVWQLIELQLAILADMLVPGSAGTDVHIGARLMPNHSQIHLRV